MFAKLSGNIDHIFEDAIILNVNSVGYKIFLSKKNLEQIRSSDVKSYNFYIETIVREDYIHLYGFNNIEEQSFFNILCKINGISSKIAIKILGSISIDQIINSINSDDKTVFTNISGIGPKLASKILIDLKDSIKKLDYNNEISNNNSIPDIKNNNQIISDAISALENLGYKRNAIYKIAIDQIKKNPEITLETLITNCLREL
ncbi:Holliday junction branch migration protein RuvA [Rickettsiales bacterium]|nr:Holliday junction branch migration protein RuvA [Rickettsiales bacterium]MDB2550340.1 Holliday junction branch migration protein RuvA [Rickettsiales bacterium]